MKLCLAGGYSRKYCFEDISKNPMKVVLAGGNNKKKYIQELDKYNLENVYILESYFYLRKDESFMQIINRCGFFLLDSGAFTFIKGNHNNKCNWDKYVEEYADFINKYDIKLFFELDIDSIVGLTEVERLRNKLEKLTNKQCIPVWHKNRGKQYFINMCKEYPYVGLGGIAIKEIKRNDFEKMFNWFIKTAHENRAKIHGLGYTSVSNLKYYHFDSVDSTAWLHGNIGGFIYLFNEQTETMEKFKKPNTSLKSYEGAKHNFREWVKLSIYAEKYW